MSKAIKRKPNNVFYEAKMHINKLSINRYNYPIASKY